MVERAVPVFCHWNGCIKEGPDGPYYEGSTLRVIRVKPKTKLTKLLNEFYHITGFDKQSSQLHLVCRYPTVVQPTMVKYVRLPVVDDSSVETMLEIPTLHPSISNVDLYLEVKPVSDEVIDPVMHSSPATNHRKDTANTRNSMTTLNVGQGSQNRELAGLDMRVVQETVQTEKENGLFEDDENYDMGGDSDDDMGDEEMSLHDLQNSEANLSREIESRNNSVDGLTVFANNVSFSDPIQSLPATSWLHDRELRKGMVFKDKDELKKVVKLYSIKRQREYEVEGSTKVMHTSRCKKKSESGCRWRLRAVKMKKHGLFEITRYCGPHTCTPTESDRGPRQLDSSFLADEIENLIKAEPSIPIAELNKQVKEKFGHTVGYRKMWYSKQKAISNIFGDWDKSFKVLPKFMAALQKSNGTIVEWQFDLLLDPNTASFRRVFWAFSQSIDGFIHCRPLISVDAIDLIGKYKGKMMVAMGIDANDQLFPLAFAITEEESFDSWSWFLSHIREKVSQRRGLCLISNPHPDILAAVNQPGSQWQEPCAYHRFCLRHLCSRFDDVFHDKQLKDYVYKAGSAHHPGKFDSYMSDIEKIKPEARRWLDAIPVAQWALVHDGGWRYGIMTTNLNEVFNTILKGARDLPILTCVHLTYDRLKILFDNRRGLANESLNRGDAYTQHVMTKLQGYKAIENTFIVTPLDQTRGIFQVVMPYNDEHVEVGGKKHIVQLSEGACTCGKWQVYKFPCSHVLAVCGRLKVNVWQYVEDYYTTEKYFRAYTPQFNSLPEESDWPESSEIPSLSPLPGCKRSGRGRPTVRLRNDSADFRCNNKLVYCSVCGQEGHGSRTCGQNKQIRPV